MYVPGVHWSHDVMWPAGGSRCHRCEITWPAGGSMASQTLKNRCVTWTLLNTSCLKSSTSGKVFESPGVSDEVLESLKCSRCHWGCSRMDFRTLVVLQSDVLIIWNWSFFWRTHTHTQIGAVTKALMCVQECAVMWSHWQQKKKSQINTHVQLYYPDSWVIINTNNSWFCFILETTTI